MKGGPFAGSLGPPKMSLQFGTLMSLPFILGSEDRWPPMLPAGCLAQEPNFYVTTAIMGLLTEHKMFQFCGFRVLLSSHFPGTAWMEGNFAIQGKLYIYSFSLVSFFRVYCIISMWPYITIQLQKESFSVSGSHWSYQGINYILSFTSCDPIWGMPLGNRTYLSGPYDRCWEQELTSHGIL